MVSKPSSESPMGSVIWWHAAHVLLVLCAISFSRKVLIGFLGSLTAEKSTSFGGVGVGKQRKISLSATPRLVGEERPGWENIDSMLIWVRMPLRPDSAGNSCFAQSPVNGNGTPYSIASLRSIQVWRVVIKLRMSPLSCSVRPITVRSVSSRAEVAMAEPHFG